jgi:uncharacterized protein YcbX
LEYDRRWMLVHGDNQLLTQRERPEMALMKVSLGSGGLLVYFKEEGDPLHIPYLPAQHVEMEVQVWDDTCTGLWVSAEADQWFSQRLNMDCKLVYMHEESQRITDPRYDPEGTLTSFSDAYPFLLIGQASLDDLNSRLSESLPMNRFRPNIVFTGGNPYQEDTMRLFKVGPIQFKGVKLCARCVITMTNQETAQVGKEPLRTLAQYRRKENKLLFGQNLVHNGRGEISVGDQIEVLEEKSLW